ncbi:hypothetical protein CRG98_002020 [Punica granatum]|uniref:Uncharacterized protein n=1 Tax=Punica granatum TaxID=22663 RepID=A0A2I0LBK4_PUNGR|nr:hypothetical protein CRG98_002020 [Punica granatum]
MKTALIAKNKVGMVDGSVSKPPEGDPNRARWDMCNALVISWIFNTLDLELQSSVAYATVAQDLWEDLRERYSQGNDTRIYQLKAEIGSLKQEGMSVSRYYSRLKTLWDELENYLETPMCSCSAFRVYTAQKEREKTHQFLMGLGSEFSTGAAGGGKLGFSTQGRKTGGAAGGMGGQQRGTGLGPNQSVGLQAHQGQKRGSITCFDTM